MDKFNKTNDNGGVVFLPDYTVKAFKNAGITLEEIATLGKMYYTSESREFNTNKNESGKFNFLIEKIKNTMSVSDVAEIDIINEFLYETILGANYNRDNSIDGTTLFIKSLSNFIKYDSSMAYDNKTIINDFINNYTYLEKDIESILVSENNKDEICTYEVQQNTVFVIIHEGFANMVLGTYSSKKLAKQYSIILMDYMFKNLGEDVTMKTPLLRMFMNLHR